MARDRATSDRMPLSHEFLAMMLGVRRAGVTVAVSTLKAAGLIYNTHGQVTILDRRGLEGACCECYHTVRNEYQRLVPQPSGFVRDGSHFRALMLFAGSQHPSLQDRRPKVLADDPPRSAFRPSDRL